MSFQYKLLFFLALFPFAVVSMETKTIVPDYQGNSTYLPLFSTTVNKAVRSFPLSFLKPWLNNVEQHFHDKKRFVQQLHTFIELFKTEKDTQFATLLEKIESTIHGHFNQKPSTTTTPTTSPIFTTEQMITPTTTEFNSNTTSTAVTTTEQIDITSPVLCNITNDLVILIDGSYSVGEANFDVSLEFAVKLSLAWKEQAESQISVIIFSTTTHTLFSLLESGKIDKEEIKKLILNANYPADYTYTHLGLRKAFFEFQNNNRSTNSLIPRNLVVLTDGASTFPTETKDEAQRITDAGIRTIAVGIGNRVNHEELVDIAGNHGQVFTTNGYYELLNLLRPISVEICVS